MNCRFLSVSSPNQVDLFSQNIEDSPPLWPLKCLWNCRVRTDRLEIWSSADSDSGGLQQGSRFCISSRLSGDTDVASLPASHWVVTRLRLYPKYHRVLSISNEIINAKGFTVDGESSSLWSQASWGQGLSPPFQILHSRCSINIVDWQPVPTSTKAPSPCCQEMKNWPLALKGQLSSSALPTGNTMSPTGDPSLA